MPPHHHATPPCHRATAGGPVGETRSRRRQPPPEASPARTQVPKSSRFVSSPARDSVVTTTTGATPSTPLFTTGFVDVGASFSICVAFGTPTLGPTITPPTPLEASTHHRKYRQRFFSVSWFYRFQWH
ncbi:hypothetical protein DEO72_LG4g397 [Vigna unguiculata]|uniref:Uncharacterized protein n=1 Tax=Vigna unguiculata TaxID=3917 RepID=A0A4D6LLS2_VIGUN|nr:hypothetical protein DEO72_LG4g397 [Vigna unguiculata]